jgi:hypothetical protein
VNLSEAIRLGAMLKPQARSMHSQWGTCALGAAADAIGVLPELKPENSGAYGRAHLALIRRWPLLGTPIENPISGTSESVRDAVMWLNDHGKWTREQIADWVATIEAQHEQQATEQPQPVHVEV